MVLVLGHKANTVKWIRRYLSEEADGVEIDIYCTPSGVRVGHLVPHREPRLLREKIGNILSNIHFTPSEKFYNFTKKAAKLTRIAMIDLKGVDYTPSCIDEIMDAAKVFEKVYISTRIHVLASKFASKGFTALLSMDHYPVDPITDVKRSRAQGVSISSDYVDQALSNRLHEEGLVLAVWTVNDEQEIARVVGLGADIIITEYPRRARQVIEKLRGG
jgi:hypothetical protein